MHYSHYLSHTHACESALAPPTLLSNPLLGHVTKHMTKLRVDNQGLVVDACVCFSLLVCLLLFTTKVTFYTLIAFVLHFLHMAVE